MPKKTALGTPEPEPEPEPKPERSSAFPPLEPDPRTPEKVRVLDIDIDPQVQRDTDDDVILKIATDLDWRLFECPTCSRMKNGRLRATEGQHRLAALRMRDPNAMVWVFVLPGEADTREDAEVALAIAKGRRGHTPYDRWQLKVHQGEPHESAAVETLDQFGLRLGKGTTASTLSCILVVDDIIHGRQRTPEQGAEALDLRVSVLMAAYPTPTNPNDQNWESGVARWDNRLVKAVHIFIDKNPHFESERLVKVLRQRTAPQWISEAASTTEKSVWNRIGEIITVRYNKHFPPDSDRRARW